jgi:carboxypeptidase Taq
MMGSVTPAYDTLTALQLRLHHLGHLQALATWDRMTQMPAGGTAARAAAQAELAQLLRDLKHDPSLHAQFALAESEPLSELQRVNLQLMQREQRLSQAVSNETAARVQRCSDATMATWNSARQANDWQSFAAPLTALVAAVRDEAEQLGQVLGLSRYDALLERHEAGLRTSRVRSLFSEVAQWLPGLIQQVRDRQSTEDVIQPEGPFPIEAQRQLCQTIVSMLGFDFERGRLDASAHPFTGGVPEDVRLTTRYKEGSFLPALLAAMHEAGHACYFQNLPREWLGQALTEPHSAALHEGQALSFERQLAPSMAFAQALSPLLKTFFGSQVAFEPHNLWCLMTRVQPGPIRVEADELTYPAHIILRTEIELELIDGTLNADDIPAAWNERMQQLLGVDTRGYLNQGPLQDVHWARGMFGYFPTYLVGTMVAAQCNAAMRVDMPDLDVRIAAGDLGCVGAWLKPRVWQVGAQFNAEELLRQITGEVLNPDCLRRHFERRYLCNT